MSEIVVDRIVLLGFLSAVAVVLVRNNYGRRRWIAFHAAKFLILLLATFMLIRLAAAVGFRNWWIQYLVIGLATPVYFGWQWRRSRWIPIRRKRDLIVRFEVRTGKSYDRRVHEIDHKMPFARGGGHTMDNLRIVERTANRRKGGTEPTLVDWVRIWRRKDERSEFTGR